MNYVALESLSWGNAYIQVCFWSLFKDEKFSALEKREIPRQEGK